MLFAGNVAAADNIASDKRAWLHQLDLWLPESARILNHHIVVQAAGLFNPSAKYETSDSLERLCEFNESDRLRELVRIYENKNKNFPTTYRIELAPIVLSVLENPDQFNEVTFCNNDSLVDYVGFLSVYSFALLYWKTKPINASLQAYLSFYHSAWPWAKDRKLKHISVLEQKSKADQFAFLVAQFAQNFRFSCSRPLAAVLWEQQFPGLVVPCVQPRNLFVQPHQIQGLSFGLVKSQDSIWKIKKQGRPLMHAVSHADLIIEHCPSVLEDCKKEELDISVVDFVIAEEEVIDKGGLAWVMPGLRGQLNTQFRIYSFESHQKYITEERKSELFRYPFTELRAEEKKRLAAAINEFGNSFQSRWHHLARNCVANLWNFLQIIFGEQLRGGLGVLALPQEMQKELAEQGFFEDAVLANDGALQ